MRRGRDTRPTIEQPALSLPELAATDAQRRATFLADASIILSASLDYETTLRTVADLAVPALGDYCYFDVLRDDTSLHRVAWRHADPSQQALLESCWEFVPPLESLDPVARVLRTARSDFVDVVTDEWLARIASGPSHLAFLRALAPCSVMTVPLVAHDRALGALTFGLAGSARPFDRDDLWLAEELARRATLAVENARLYAESQRERERLEETGRFRELLLGMISHDLRGPLSAILAGSDTLLRRAELSDATAQMVARIASSGRRMERLIAQILDFTRIRLGGGVALRPGRVDLAQVCRQVVGEIEMGHPGRAIHFTATGDTVGEWDWERIAQVVANLVGNAVVHGAAAPIEVRAGGDADEVVLEVYNQGAPITPALLPVLFDPFRRGDRSTRSDGLGLGLYIAQQLVAAHGGRLDVRSTAKQGTTFTARLPRRA